jgi:hypothetical protein
MRWTYFLIVPAAMFIPILIAHAAYCGHYPGLNAQIGLIFLILPAFLSCVVNLVCFVAWREYYSPKVTVFSFLFSLETRACCGLAVLQEMMSSFGRGVSFPGFQCFVYTMQIYQRQGILYQLFTLENDGHRVKEKKGCSHFYHLYIQNIRFHFEHPRQEGKWGLQNLFVY